MPGRKDSVVVADQFKVNRPCHATGEQNNIDHSDAFHFAGEQGSRKIDAHNAKRISPSDSPGRGAAGADIGLRRALCNGCTEEGVYLSAGMLAASRNVI